MTWPKSAFWTYSLDLYGRPGVENACLSLQDRRGLDVNLVLLAFWLSTRGIALDRSSVATAEEAVRDLRGQVVQPLRSVRRYLRSIMKASSSIANDWLEEVEHLGNQVAKAELDGEHLCQLALEQLSAGLAASHPPGTALAAANLAMIAAFKNEDKADLRALFHGAFPDLSPAATAGALRRLDPA